MATELLCGHAVEGRDAYDSLSLHHGVPMFSQPTPDLYLRQLHRFPSCLLSPIPSLLDAAQNTSWIWRRCRCSIWLVSLYGMGKTAVLKCSLNRIGSLGAEYSPCDVSRVNRPLRLLPPTTFTHTFYCSYRECMQAKLVFRDS